MNITVHQTDHFEDRKGGVKPSFVIVHFTEVTFEEAHGLFTGALTQSDVENERRADAGCDLLTDDEAAAMNGRVSAHYVIGYDGSVHRYVPEDKRAWHAGVSSWGDVGKDMNSHSVGIELVNSGDEPFPQEQIDAFIKLARDIMQRHDITAERVLGHDEIAPGRKIDPGPLFPWQSLAGEGVALWPRPKNPALTDGVKKLAKNDLSP